MEPKTHPLDLVSVEAVATYLTCARQLWLARQQAVIAEHYLPVAEQLLVSRAWLARRLMFAGAGFIGLGVLAFTLAALLS